MPDRIKVWEALDLFSSLVPEGPPWETVLDEWGLSNKRAAKFGNLSGGQQQRLFVALAVVNAPRLVFFDEMTTGLDPMSRRVTWDLVRQVQDQVGERGLQQTDDAAQVFGINQFRFLQLDGTRQ